jgi:acid phosphatase type 7
MLWIFFMLKATIIAATLFCVLLFVACSADLSIQQPTPTPAGSTAGSTSQVTATTALPGSTAADNSVEDQSGSFPIRAAFYYPWFPDAWAQEGLTPYSHYTPTLGYYNSSNIELIQQHIEAMDYGQIDAGIASWWGQGHHTDGRISALLTATQGTDFRWTLYYEAEGQGDPTGEQITGDLNYIWDNYGQQANYLQIDGRMVLFIFANTGEGEDGCEMIERWQQANSVNAYLVFKVFRGYRDCATQPDGWHQYAPAVAESSQRGYSFSISPGFWAADSGQARLARNLEQWRQGIRNMVASGAPFQLITSFNEWGEGTAVEAATDWASDSTFGLYLDALHDNGGVAANDAAVAVAADPTPWPTPLPTPTPSSIITVSALADTYVSQESPESDYGSALLLRTDMTPTIRSYLRFEVPPLPDTLQRARLQLFANNGSTLGFEVLTLTPTVWNEITTTFVTAPPPGYVLGSSGPVEPQSWAEIDVTNGISQPGTVDFVLQSLNNSAVSYASRESSTPPTLVLELGPLTNASVVTDSHVLYAVGDIADCEAEGDEATAALLDNRPGTILTLGDTVYMSGTIQQFTDCFDPVWGRHKERIRPAVGNHEYITPDAMPYYAYFGTAAGEPDKGYYSFDLGGWHVVALNSNCTEVGGCHVNSPQEQWLRADLASHPTHCTIAYMHHPRWSSGKYGENNRVQPLVEALYDYGVDLLLTGHGHQYERFGLQDPNGNRDPARGIREIVVGTGGKNHQPVIEVLPNSEVREATTFGVLELTLYSGSYIWNFLPEPGKTFTDRGSEACR